MVLGLVLMFYGCASAPSGQWVQPGRTQAETTEDFHHCEKVAMQESEGMRSTEPFKEDLIKQKCMQRMGYKWVKTEPK